MATQKDKNQTLAEKAYELIEEMIVTLKLSPGAVFSEADLSRQLNIGRTPIREALQRLSGERLVIALPRRGMMVTEINIANQLALLETRRELDKLIATRAARRATPEQREILKELANFMQQAADESNLAEFMRVDHEFDQVVEVACRNPFAVQANASLHAHSRRFWYYYQANGDLKRSTALHVALIHAVMKGDEAAAAQASNRLLDYLEELIRLTLELD
jgi:DNA-binding GntR family transcriptional regulator